MIYGLDLYLGPLPILNGPIGSHTNKSQSWVFESILTGLFNYMIINTFDVSPWCVISIFYLAHMDIEFRP